MTRCLKISHTTPTLLALLLLGCSCAFASDVKYSPWFQQPSPNADRYSCDYFYPDKTSPQQLNKQKMVWLPRDQTRRGYYYFYNQKGECWGACRSPAHPMYNSVVMQWSVMKDGAMVPLPPGECPAPKNGDPKRAQIDKTPDPPTAQGAKSVELVMSRLTCNKTTEPGADEVYLLVLGKRSDGSLFVARWPTDNPKQPLGHWDMNDGDQPENNPQGDSHAITNKSLFVGDVPNGLKWDLTIIVMEEDGGSSQKFQEAGAAALIQTGNPYAVGAGVILEVLTKAGFFIPDEDDHIGSFGVSIVNNNGTLASTWKPMERVKEKESVEGKSASYNFEGDGSIYAGAFEIKLK